MQDTAWPQATRHRVSMAELHPDLPYLWPCDVSRLLGMSPTFVRQKVRPAERHGDRLRWSWNQIEAYRESVRVAGTGG